MLEESLSKYFGDNTTPSHLKLADVPDEDTTRLLPNAADGHSTNSSGSGSSGVGTALSPFPLVAVRNVFVMPGAAAVCGAAKQRNV
jgi:hypothetical protein